MSHESRVTSCTSFVQRSQQIIFGHVFSVYACQHAGQQLHQVKKWAAEMRDSVAAAVPSPKFDHVIRTIRTGFDVSSRSGALHHQMLSVVELRG